MQFGTHYMLRQVNIDSAAPIFDIPGMLQECLARSRQELLGVSVLPGLKHPSCHAAMAMKVIWNSFANIAPVEAKAASVRPMAGNTAAKQYLLGSSLCSHQAKSAD